ncbi:MAG: MFS transporter [Ruminococcaceae bacterium]|nr:MFS transporter [Oscillospiraceae bacterium]
MNIKLIQYIRGDYRCTAAACCIAYMTQSVAVNFAPLLFLTFNEIYSLPLSKVTVLVAISFIIQLAVDFLSALIIDKLDQRHCMIFALIISAIGFVGLGVLPDIIPDAFVGIIIACILYSSGSGLIEVLTSPIIESCPLGNKPSAMSFMHSFFCWGTVLVIGLSTVFFSIFGKNNWRILSCGWAFIPLVNTFLFMLVPLPSLSITGEKQSAKNFINKPLFWATAMIMLCGGASCHSVSQWASAFAELNIGITKTTGDIAGPFLFAVLMGISRVFHSRISKKIHITSYMLTCAVLCFVSYLMISFVRVPIVSVAGGALCGFSCGVFWPGTFSLAAEKFNHNGTVLFALLSLSGDIGCTLGPSVVGFVASCSENNLSLGIISAAIFPLLLVVLIFLMNKSESYSLY